MPAWNESLAVGSSSLDFREIQTLLMYHIPVNENEDLACRDMHKLEFGWQVRL